MLRAGPVRTTGESQAPWMEERAFSPELPQAEQGGGRAPARADGSSLTTPTGALFSLRSRMTYSREGQSQL